MKKILLNPWTSILTLILVVFIRYQNPEFLESIRLRYFDTLISNKQVIDSDNISIVNIDDESLKQYGQFPFPRDKYKDIIQKLYDRNAGLVVFNIFTPDKDRFGKDKIFQEFLNEAPVILPQTASNDDIDYGTGFNPGVAEIGESAKIWTPNYKSILPNIFTSSGVGIVNTLPEIDGVVRRLPMLVTSKDILYPSLALETLRVAAGDSNFQVKSTEFGIEAVRIPQYGKITTDQFGRIWIDWSHLPKEYSLVSLPESFDRKIVIVGLTARGLNNPVSTSMGERFPHQLQGAVLDTLLTNTNIQRPDYADGVEILVFVLLSIISILISKWRFGFAPIVIIVSSIPFVCSYIFNSYNFLFDASFVCGGIALVYVHSYTIKFLSELSQKLQIKKQFGTYLSPALVEKLQKNPELLTLGGETRQLSIMFTDVRGFTSISEHYGENVQGLTQIMNRYMTAMTSAILKNDGTLDKYIGDAQMAFWNAPLDIKDHAKLATKTALEMLGSLNEFNQEICKEGVPPFGMGLGINTADVVVGNMGSVQRFDYTCLGDGVNLASRLEGQSKPYGVKIVIGPITAKLIEDEYFVLELDKLAVKGKKEGVNIFTVLSRLEDSLEYKLAQQKHESMLSLYREMRWKESALLCQELIGEFNGEMDSYYRMLIERIADYEYKNKPPKDWDGTFIATSK